MKSLKKLLIESFIINVHNNEMNTNIHFLLECRKKIDKISLKIDDNNIFPNSQRAKKDLIKAITELLTTSANWLNNLDADLKSEINAYNEKKNKKTRK